MTLIKRAKKISLDGKGSLTLSPNDYVTQGGEGVIYQKGKTVIKLYLDSKKMAQDNMTDKIRLLARGLKHPSIVAPEGVVFDQKNNPIGYHMPFVTGEPYPRIFTNDWRSQNGFNDKAVTILAGKMHEVVDFAHSQGALMVDANELNWLADVRDVNNPVPYAIDVDSWQIDKFKASVIMPSVRDWHSQDFGAETDWFAWGVVSFLLFTGVHPYKGKLDGYKPGELERRMKDNASVFLPEVRLNKAVRDFRSIPGPLLDWYQATFTKGERSVPPSPFKTGKTNTNLGRVMRVVATTTGGLIYEKLFDLANDEVISVWPCGIIRTKSGKLIDLATKKEIGKVSGSRVAIIKKDNGWLVSEMIGSGWQWRHINRNGLESLLSVPVTTKSVVRSDNRIFVTTETELIELTLQQFSKPVITIGKRWSVLSNATKWFQGIGVSDVLGAMHLIAPFAESSVAIVRVPELDGLKPVNGLCGNRWAEIITINKQGEYEAHDLSFDAEWKKYSLQSRKVDGPDQNLVALPKGVTASIPEDGELIISVPTKGEQKVIKDKDLATDMRLANIENKVVYRKDGALWSLRMQ